MRSPTSRSRTIPGRPRRLLHAAECSRPRGVPRRARSDGRPAAPAPDREGADESLLPHARDRPARLRPRHVEPALLNTITSEHDAAWRRQIRPHAGSSGRARPGHAHRPGHARRRRGDVTGLTLEEGETLVFRPLGNSRFRLVGPDPPRRLAGHSCAVLRPGASGQGIRGPCRLAPARRRTGGRRDVWYTAQEAGSSGGSTRRPARSRRSHSATGRRHTG